MGVGSWELSRENRRPVSQSPRLPVPSSPSPLVSQSPHPPSLAQKNGDIDRIQVDPDCGLI